MSERQIDEQCRAASVAIEESWWQESHRAVPHGEAAWRHWTAGLDATSDRKERMWDAIEAFAA